MKVSSLSLSRIGGASGEFYAVWGAPSGKKLSKKILTSSGKAAKKESTRAGAVSGYRVTWKYDVLLSNGKTKTVDASTSDVTNRNATFSPPEEAIRVRVYVKPLPKQYVTHKKQGTKKSGKKTVPNYVEVKKNWFTGESVAKDEWTDARSATPPQVPELTVSGSSVEIAVSASDPYADRYQAKLFQYRSGAWVCVFDKTSNSTETAHTFRATGLQAGGTYQANARTRRENGKWSGWAGRSASALLAPPKPSRPAMRSLISGIEVSWAACLGAAEYEVAYAETLNQLQSSSQMSTASQGATSIVLPVDVGRAYYAKVRAKNATGEGPWSDAAGPLKYGSVPDPPTIWSSAASVVREDGVDLCWLHNSTDDSQQTSAQVSVSTDGGATWAVAATLAAESIKHIDTSGYTDGTVLLWRVRTKGIVDAWSGWSETRAVNVWEQPTLVVAAPETVERLPLDITVDPCSPSQTPIAADVSIVAKTGHYVSRPDGTERWVGPGDTVWSAHYDRPPDPINVSVSAGDVSLESAQTYGVAAVCAMSSGLSCSGEAEFFCDFEDADISISLNISANGEYAAEVAPFAYDGEGGYAEGVTLSIYRHETDGTMTPLVKGMPNDGTYSIVDEHASFGLASYRAVALVADTGQVVYGDDAEDVLTAESILIQWGADIGVREHAPGGDDVEDASETSVYLELPGNIEMSEDNDPDQSHIAYIGRKHPVAYYGTQLGQTASWTCVVEKDDAETLALLRELAALQGDVYVREPLGSGYWASAVPSWSSSYESSLVKVSIDVKRIDRVDECEVFS